MKLLIHSLTYGCLTLMICVTGWAQKPELVVQTGHSEEVQSMAFSADGKTLASGSGDSTIKLWDVATGSELRTLTGSCGGVTSVSFNADGKIIAGGSGRGVIKLWNIATGRELGAVTGHCESSGAFDKLTDEPIHVRSIVFTADGKTLASSSDDGTIKIWDLATRSELRTLKEAGALSLAFSPNGEMLAEGNEKAVHLWDVSTGRELRTLVGGNGAVGSVAFSADGNVLASGNWSGTIKIWKVATGQELRTLAARSGGHTVSVAFSSDGKKLSGAIDRTIQLWDVATGTEVRAFDALKGVSILEPTSVALSRDGRTLAAAMESEKGHIGIKLWNVETGAPLGALQSHSKAVQSVAFSHDGKRLASAGWDNTTKLWDLTTDRELITLEQGYNSRVYDHAVMSVAFSPDSSKLASGSLEGLIVLWDVASGQKLEAEGGSKGLWSVAFSPDGNVLAADHAETRTIRLWDIAGPKQPVECISDPMRSYCEGEFRDILASPTAVALSPDGKTLASGDVEGFLLIWDVAVKEKPRFVRRTAEKPTYDSSHTINSVAFSPDGKLLASGGREVKLWDVAAGKELRTLNGHAFRVRSVAFSPDGKSLASGSDDNTIKLWDVTSGQELHTLAGHSAGVSSVSYSSDGHILASGSADGTVKLWDVAKGIELATLVAVDQRDWLVVTPDGLFDGSPPAWKDIAWRLNSNTFNYTPVEAYFVDFFHPGLLQEILGGKRPKPPQGKELEKRDRRRPSVALNQVRLGADSSSVKPANLSTSNNIRNVSIQVEVTENVDEVSGESQPMGGGAKDVRLFRNGSLVKVWRGDAFEIKSGCTHVESNGAANNARPRKAICAATVPVTSGENEFTAYAFNHDNLKSEDAKALVVNGDKSLERKGVFYVLAVGVNKYKDEQYNLNFAVADVDEIGKELKAQQDKLNNYARTEIIVLTDALASKANLLIALRRFADGEQMPVPDGAVPALKQELKKIKNVQPEDALMIYYAGHGAVIDERFYLLLHDFIGGSEQQQKESSVSDIELNEALERVGSGKIVLVIDACQSGQALGGEKEGRGPMNSKGMAQLAYDKGMYILTAAQSYQAAKEVSRSQAGNKVEHGLLTFALLEGLSKAKVDKEGKVTEREWMNYAVDQVPLMQIEEMVRRQSEINIGPAQGKGRGPLVFLQEDDAKTDAEKRRVQRPRVFYRRELEAHSMIVSKH